MLSFQNKAIPYILFVVFIAAFFSCKKDPQSRPTANPTLTSFNVTVAERLPARAIINWTECENLTSADTVKYKVFLNGHLIHTDLLRLNDTLLNLSADSAYTGLVLAYTSNTDTISAGFYLDKLDGYIMFGMEDPIFRVANIFTGNRSLDITMPNEANYWDYFGPTISNDTVFFGNTNLSGNTLFAYNFKTGANLWNSMPGTNGYSTLFTSNPVYNQGKLYGSTGEGLISVSAATGQVLWTNQNTIDDFGGEPVIVGDKIFMPSTPGGRHVFAVNKADGNVLWNYAYDGQMGGRVLHNNGRIFFGTSSSKVYALDANTGALIWTRNFHNANDDYGCDGISPVTFNGNIIIHHYPEGFIALNPATGNTVWAAQDASDISCSQPAIGNGLLYFTLDGGAGRSIVAIRGDNGQLAWETPTTSPSLGNVIFVNNRLYMQSRTSIQIRSAADGSLINIIDWGGSNGVGSAAISLNGVAYYGTGRGN